MRPLLFMLLLFTLFPVAVYAEDAKKEEVTPITEWVAAEKKLVESMNGAARDVFYVLRNKYAIIRAVRVVQRDVEKAVKACGKKNAHMKKEMNARYQDWKGAVEPVLDDADKFLKKEVAQQKAVYESDFYHVMKMNDKAYTYGESQVDKQIVTTEEACTSLWKSMDRTEDQMVTLLTEMLIPENVVRERMKKAEDAKKDAAEASGDQKE